MALCDADRNTLARLWAKSPVAGQARGEGLTEHTVAVLRRLSGLYRTLPGLTQAVGEPRLWHRAFWACVLHDLGKAAAGFQRQLGGAARRWGHRHEVLSLAFVDWALPGDPHGDRAWVASGVASHHRDRDELTRLYPLPAGGDDLGDGDDPILRLIGEVSDEAAGALGRWLLWQVPELVRECGLPGVECHVEVPDDPAQDFRQRAADRVQACLLAYHRLVRDLGAQPAASRENLAALALRGLVVMADHTASAGVDPAVADLGEPLAVAARLGLPGREALYGHQLRVTDCRSHALLVAPTGSGKTEAGLLWASSVGSAAGAGGRVFYVLPYQASLNAMYDRLGGHFPGRVALQHSRALQALYRRLLEGGDDPRDAAATAHRQKALSRLHHHPIRVLTPYQLLRAAFRLKGYEALLTDAAGGRFVLDEIHAYDTRRLGMILATMDYLARNLGGRFLVMSATLPGVLRRLLREVLGEAAEVRADASLYQAYSRHVIRLERGQVTDSAVARRIAGAARSGKAVLVVCNVVETAKRVRDQLVSLLEGTGVPVWLLHSRFTARDRFRKEQQLLAAMGTRRRAAEGCPLVLVATQVVEVSLDIDFDLLYTEPAPLESLAQRFGRVNRARRLPAADVCVLTEPQDGQGVYAGSYVEAALEVVRQHAGARVDESRLDVWLDSIYSGPVGQNWADEVRHWRRQFVDACLKDLRAFQSSPELADAFDEMFDGTEVVPDCLAAEHSRLLREDALRASELLVPISFRQLWRLRRAGRVMRSADDVLVACVPYDPDRGLDLAQG